jgi:hypothetical protein
MLHSLGPIKQTRQAEGDAITPCRVKEEAERPGSGHDQEHRSGAGPSRPQSHPRSRALIGGVLM